MKCLLINVSDEICIDYRVRNFCKLPYPDHPKGCPNYGKNLNCPPMVASIENIFDLSKPLRFMIKEFNLQKFSMQMKLKHPTWTERQCRCVLYWQKGVVSKLNNACIKFISGRTELIYSLIPEALGVDVFKTMQRLNRPLQRNPSMVYKIALIGNKKVY